MNGEIAEGVLPELLRSLYVERRSGMLRLVRGEEEQSLRFHGGHIVNAQTSIKTERLGEMLVRRGLLSAPDLVRSTEIVMREKRRLGAVLAELGLLDRNGLEDAIAFHVHEMLARLFAWPDGRFSFEDEPEETSREEVTLKLSTGELILEAVRAVKDPDVVRYALGDIDGVLALSSDPLLRFQKLTLSPADGFVLSRIDGVASAREILQMIPLPAEETQKSLFGLLSTGVIAYTGEKRRKREPPRRRPRLPIPCRCRLHRPRRPRPRRRLRLRRRHPRRHRRLPPWRLPRPQRPPRPRPPPPPHSIRRRTSAGARSSRRGRAWPRATTSRCSGCSARSARPR